jgi:hypothetical protein
MAGPPRSLAIWELLDGQPSLTSPFGIMNIAAIRWGYVQLFFYIMAFSILPIAYLLQRRKNIEFRGARVSPDWPEKLKQAQEQTHYSVSGKRYFRVRYGEEQEDWGASSGRPCHDCAALKGEFHVLGCDVERCPVCGAQAITCDCAYEGVKK